MRAGPLRGAQARRTMLSHFGLILACSGGSPAAAAGQDEQLADICLHGISLHGGVSLYGKMNS